MLAESEISDVSSITSTNVETESAHGPFACWSIPGATASAAAPVVACKLQALPRITALN